MFVLEEKRRERRGSQEGAEEESSSPLRSIKAPGVSQEDTEVFFRLSDFLRYFLGKSEASRTWQLSGSLPLGPHTGLSSKGPMEDASEDRYIKEGIP